MLAANKVREAMCLTLGQWLYRWLFPVITSHTASSSITEAEAKNHRYRAIGFYARQRQMLRAETDGTAPEQIENLES